MNTLLKGSLSLFLLLVIGACSTTLTSVDDKGGNVYALPAEVADQMLKDAVSTEIPSGTLRRVRIPRDPGHPFHSIPVTDSTRSRSPVPRHSGH
jgi:hypothetical protein